VSFAAQAEAAPHVSIHALKEECDLPLAEHQKKLIVSIDALNEECDMNMQNSTGSKYLVSIHALNEECDGITLTTLLKHAMFQSTHSMKSATFLMANDQPITDVSIHALNEECVYNLILKSFASKSFNPRTQ